MGNQLQNTDEICCPKFDPTPWDNKEIIWKDKLFVTDDVFCIFHIPINMGKVLTRMNNKVTEAKAEVDAKDFILLSQDVSNWKSVQYYAVSKEIPGMNNVKLSGTFLSKVFEGPYKDAKKWYYNMIEYVRSKGKEAKNIYFYYTTCPKCAKKWGKNYVVVLAQIE
jgi:hypothetical protein